MITFDIETAAAPDDVLKKLMPQFEADKRLKDPDKIAADLASKEAEWKERAALSALTGQILVIGLLKGDEAPVILDGQEEHILEEFWDWWRAGGKFAGFAIKHFDIPFLAIRSRILQVDIPYDIMEGRYFSQRFVDLQEVWCCFQKDIRGHSLDAVCRACGLGQKTGDGANFAKLWRDDKRKAIQYLCNDLTLAKALANRLGVV